MSKQRLICASCEKRGPVQSFCQHCGHPTVAATYEERIVWEMGQWESSRSRQGAAPAPAPPAPPVRNLRPSRPEPVQAGPDIAPAPARQPRIVIPKRTIVPRPAAEQARPAAQVRPQPSPRPAPPRQQPGPSMRPAASAPTPLRAVPSAPPAQAPAPQRPAALQRPAPQQPQQRPRPLIPRPTRPLSAAASATAVEQIEALAPATLDAPLEQVAPANEENGVLLIRTLQRDTDTEQAERQAAELAAEEAALREAAAREEAARVAQEQAAEARARAEAEALAEQEREAARLAEEQAQRAEAEARRLEAEEQARAEQEAKQQAKAAKAEAKAAEKAARAQAKIDAKQAKAAAKQQKVHAKQAEAPAHKMTRRERNHARDVAALEPVDGEVVTERLRGRCYGPASLLITNYRVAVVSGRRTRVRWIPLEEVNQIDTMWRSAPTVVIGGTVELLRFRMRKARALSAVVHTLMGLVQASKVPGSSHHNAELTQAWCDKAGEIWDSQTGRIRLFIRRHPVFTLSWLTTLVPIAYFAAR